MPGWRYYPAQSSRTTRRKQRQSAAVTSALGIGGRSTQTRSSSRQSARDEEPRVRGRPPTRRPTVEPDRDISSSPVSSKADDTNKLEHLAQQVESLSKTVQTLVDLQTGNLPPQCSAQEPDVNITPRGAWGTPLQETDVITDARVSPQEVNNTDARVHRPEINTQSRDDYQQQQWPPAHQMSQPADISSFLLKETGVPADSLQNIEIVSHQMKRDIVAGKDVNLAQLLLPVSTPGSAPGANEALDRSLFLDSNALVIRTKPDSRLHKHLTIQDFVLAFTTYRNIMCEAYPGRRQELDQYLRDIIEMSSRYGGGLFYDYHKAFSAKAATFLLNHNIKVDWSKRDTKLFTTIFSGQKIEPCKACGTVGHHQGFCPLDDNVEARKAKPTPTPMSMQNRALFTHDKQGRQRVRWGQGEICNHFNDPRGCHRQRCSFLHLCLKCKQAHPFHSCPQTVSTVQEPQPTSNPPKPVPNANKPKTPV